MNYEKQIQQTEKWIACARELSAAFCDDPHRPAYHFVPPSAWMNDINGCLFWKGRYHIFYQHNPDGGYWKWMQWGHASSVDLVHWVHHPIALTPTLNGPDRDGCASGGALVSKEGIPTFIYWGIPDGVCTATSQDDLLIHWTKHPANPVIAQPKPGEREFGKYTIHDPCVLLSGETYYAVVNRRNPDGKGDGAFLFRSQNLVCWDYVGLLYESRREWTEAEEDCAVPDLFRLGDRHMLLFLSHLQATQYYLGHFDGEKFDIETHARMAWPGGQLGGARTLLDGQGRRIFLDWIREISGVERERASGWSGVMTLPRVLSLATDGTLLIEPVPEAKALRMNHRTRADVQLTAHGDLALEEMSGDCLELSIEVEMGQAQEVGVKVRCSPDGAEQTVVSYDAAAGKLKVDVSRSTLDSTIRYPYYRDLGALERLGEAERYVHLQEGPFELVPDEILRLRIFLDRSVLEVFANGRQCITQRIYPTRRDSVGVFLFARGGPARVQSVEAWDMAPAHE